MDMQSCSKRIFEVAELLNLQDKDISSATGVSRSAMSKIRAGKQQVPMAMIVEFADKFPRVNLDYIVRGKEPKLYMSPDDLAIVRELKAMIGEGIDVSEAIGGLNLEDITSNGKSIGEDVKKALCAKYKRVDRAVSNITDSAAGDVLNCVCQIAPAKEVDTVMIPIVSSDATASFIDSLEENSADYILEETPVVPRRGENLNDGRHYVFVTKGNSMCPTIMDGAKILTQKVGEGEWEYIDGVVVVVYGKSLVVKRIQHNDLFTNNYIELFSDNKNYGSIKVQRCDIRGIFKVKRKIDEDIS